MSLLETIDIHSSGAYPSPLVVFIDDDLSILEAMTAVIEQWGIDLAADVDVSEVKEDRIALGRTPDAILSDYRLKDGRTGAEAIAELRAVFGNEIPAALITGDTASPPCRRLIPLALLYCINRSNPPSCGPT